MESLSQRKGKRGKKYYVKMPETEGFSQGDLFIIVGMKVHDGLNPSSRDTEWCAAGSIIPKDEYKKVDDIESMIDYFLKAGARAVIKKARKFRADRKTDCSSKGS